ncbi:MAG: class I SAM-dependent methyltransferase, partial [Muribaculaceae bacterium]|nr:class I SAM-dependent methyltransferase [Muribaculaceae bacterium]
LPGIPLAIIFPDVHFHLIDRVGKKIKVAQEIASAIGLTNVSFQHGDSGECHEKFDFVVSRAVMPQADLLKLSRKNISNQQKNALPNGIISLKGGNLDEELKPVKKTTEVVEIKNFFSEPFFDTKKIVYTTV